jgi:hypothetical protein
VSDDNAKYVLTRPLGRLHVQNRRKRIFSRPRARLEALLQACERIISYPA